MNMDVTIEQDLVRRAQAGDCEAFGELVLSYQRFVYNLALRALSDPQEAQDAAQEAFLRAWLALPNFRRDARFSTWLYRIVVNLCFNRRPRLRKDLAALPVEDEPDLLDEFDGPAELAESREQQAYVHQQVERLPESYRVLILLRYQEDLSYEEIAGVLNLPLGTVKTGLFRAKAQLKAALINALAVQSVPMAVKEVA